MQVSVEVLEGLERRMTVQVPAEKIDSEVQRRLQDLTQRVRLDGFRPGKVPMKVIKRRYGAAVREEVANELVQSTFFEALSQEKLRPAGGPDIDVTSAEEGGDYEYLATFEVYPEIEVAGVESVEVKRPVAQVVDADVDRMVEKLRKQRTIWNTTPRTAEDGDQVTIDFKGFLGDEVFEGGQGEDMPVVIGTDQLIPGFEDHLKGLAAGEEKSFSVTFPDTYPNHALAGRDARFEVTVKDVAEAELPPLDDDFAKSFGVDEGGTEKLRSELRDNMSRELDQAVRAQLKQQVMDGLLAANEVSLPTALVDREILNMSNQAEPAETDDHPQTTVTDDLRERYGAHASRRVSLGLIVAELVSANDIQPDQDEITARIDGIATTYQDPEQVRGWYRQNQQAMEGVRAMVLEDQVVAWVLERARISDEPTSFDAVMNPEEPAG
jgi:trigger factor